MSAYPSFLKITDPDYSLPQIIALEGGKRLETGTNDSMIIIGLDNNGGKGEYVIKFKGSNRMTDPSANLREICGACIARQLGLTPAPPVVISVTQNFVDTLIGNDIWNTASTSLGLNFGTVYIPKFPAMNHTTQLTEFQLKEGEKIFALDSMILNFDRRTGKNDGKPNIISNGIINVLLDHEIAFGFTATLPWNQNPTPWVVAAGDLNVLKDHYFYPHLKGNNVDFSVYSDDFASIDTSF